MIDLVEVRLAGPTDDDAAYVRVSDMPVSRTQELEHEGSGVLVDFADDGLGARHRDAVARDEERAIAARFAAAQCISLARYEATRLERSEVGDAEERAGLSSP